MVYYCAFRSGVLPISKLLVRLDTVQLSRLNSDLLRQSLRKHLILLILATIVLGLFVSKEARIVVAKATGIIEVASF